MYILMINGRIESGLVEADVLMALRKLNSQDIGYRERKDLMSQAKQYGEACFMVNGFDILVEAK